MLFLHLPLACVWLVHPNFRQIFIPVFHSKPMLIFTLLLRVNTSLRKDSLRTFRRNVVPPFTVSTCLRRNQRKSVLKIKLRTLQYFTWVSTFRRNWLFTSYVYWNVHHLDSWIKIDQLDVTCFIISLFNAQHLSNVSTSILRSLRLICCVISWVVLLWFDVC